jgi:hypothetical protein
VAAILPTVKVRAVADPDERVSAKQLALGLPKHTWRTITWRDGSADRCRGLLSPAAMSCSDSPARCSSGAGAMLCFRNAEIACLAANPVTVGST